MPDLSEYEFKYFRVTFPAEYVAHVELNRPEKYNAINPEYVWHGLWPATDAAVDDLDDLYVM